jgi:hypothetical protein
MARGESNHEDLFAEATALVERIELVPADSTAVVAGFRKNGEFSVFFGDDPAYHFNADNELRRAYCDGLLIKANSGRLASLRRVRTENETQLVHHVFSDAEQEAFLAETTRRMEQLEVALTNEAFELKGQVPADTDVLRRVSNWLAARKTWQVSDRPNI